ncbi:MAG: putative metal-binding motif-containing protein [Myxococcales bacterium]|nr:putative metal-binding motif-containing protein [Myxococcales bacterium]
MMNRWMVLAVAIGLALALPERASAYDEYAAGCDSCHGDFRASPYVSLADGSDWGDSLHNGHRRTMLASDCDACHVASGRTPVFLNSSAGGMGLAALSCAGCHGRVEDDVPANPAVAAGGVGMGAGLRQHHYNSGVMVCAGCHADADPMAYAPVGEDVLPPYYAAPGTNHPDMPLDSCNPAGTEHFFGAPVGLDNDGDLVYDMAEPECSPCADADGDGFSPDGGACGAVDCVDTDVAIFPGAVEACNGFDDNCDGVVDEGCAVDAGVPDGSVDAGVPDGSVDAGVPDGSVDAGVPDGSVDAGVPDGSVDAGVPVGDASVGDGGVADGSVDASVGDGSVGDASVADASAADASSDGGGLQPDGAMGDGGVIAPGNDGGCGCRVPAGSSRGSWPALLLGLGAALWLARRRRR